MKKVFLVDTNPLQISIWESYLRGSEWELYTLKSLEDFSFRCNDFAPDIIVLGSSFGNEQAISTVQKAATQIPLAVIDFKEKTGEVLCFEAPFKPSEIEIILNKLLAKSKGI